MTSNTIAALDQQERTITAAQRAASDERARKALQLAKSPDDVDTQDELAALEHELAGYSRDLARVAAARRAYAAAEAENTHEARLQRLAAAKAAVQSHLQDRITAAGKVQKALADLESALVAEGNASAKAYASALIAGQVLCPDDAYASHALTSQVLPHVGATGPALSHLNRVLRSAAEAGHKLGQSVQILGLHDPQPSPVEDAERGAERVAAIVSTWTLGGTEGEA